MRWGWETVGVVVMGIVLGGCSGTGSGSGSGTGEDGGADGVVDADVVDDDAPAQEGVADSDPDPAPDTEPEPEPEPDAEPDPVLDLPPEVELPPRVCKAWQPWAGAVAFTDVTEAAGLKALGVAGTRLGAADWDGDGRPDLAVRNYYAERDDFAEGGKRYTWMLRNAGGMAFEDVTKASGFAARPDGGEGRVTHVVVFGDLDNDGDLDAVSGVNVNPDPAAAEPGDRTEVLLNDGDGTFSLGPGGALREAEKRMPTSGIALTDADLDGVLDAWVGYAQGKDQPEPDRLYRGDGAGSFTDVTVQSGLMTLPWKKMTDVQAGRVHRNTWGATACDLNGDGRPDLLSAVYGRYFNALWLNGQGSGPGGAFKDLSMASGYASDERTDWRTNLNAQCFCKLNPTAEDCPGTPAPPGYFSCKAGQQLRWNHDYDRQAWRLGGNTFSTACGDVDNDGDLDLVNFEIVHWDVGPSSDPMELLLNDGAAEPRFARPGNEATGLARDWDGKIDWNAGDMTGALLDFDNDGRKDLLVGSSDYPYTRAFLFHQKADGTFEEVAPDKGIAHPRSHGVAVADFDGDGDVDVALGHGLARCEGDKTCYATHEVHLFRNEVGQDANVLRVTLVGGAGSNRSAIGARVRVAAGGVTQSQEVGGGYGHFGIQHELTLTFGLGAACDVDSVEVRWPDAAGTTETWTAVRANYAIRVAQGVAEVDHVAALP